MSTRFGVGFSNHINPEKAAQDAAFHSKTDLRSNSIDLAIVFCTAHYPPKKVIPVLNKVLNNAKMYGTSTAGVIAANRVETRGIGVLTVSSEEFKMASTVIEDITTLDVREAGALMAKSGIHALGDHTRQALLFLGNGQLNYTGQFVKGMQESLGNAFAIIGAGNSNNHQYDNTFQFTNTKIFKRSIIGFLLGGQLSVTYAARHGWRPLGKPRSINKAEGPVLHAVNGKAATALYEEYFQEKDRTLLLDEIADIATRYPLGIALKDSREYLIRNAIDFLPDGSIVCQGDVPQGGNVHIMIGNKDSCHQAAMEAAKEVRQGLKAKRPKLVLILESISRLKLLSRDAPKEIQKIKSVFGSGVPMIGMYTSGEVYPSGTAGLFKKTYHQSHSIIIVAIA